MLNHASTTQKIVCSFDLSRSSCLLTLVYQLIVKSIYAFVHRCLLLLWPVKSFYSGMTRRNKTPVPHPYLGLGQNNCTPQIKMPIQLLLCSTLEYYHLLYRDYCRNCTPSYELLVQWYFSPSLVIPRPSCWCNRNTDKWIVMCEINTPSNSLLGSKWTIFSFLARWLLNHHSKTDCAT